MTFTRRAAAEMLRRVDGVLHRLTDLAAAPAAYRAAGAKVWGGTFHAIATRLLRRYGKAIGLAGFTIHDRSDSEDFLNVLRTELGLAKTDRRFPKKGTCLDIYSRCVNARQQLADALATQFPWCNEWGEQLKRLFDAYVDRKEAASILDYDDLLLYWHGLLADPKAGNAVRKLFDWVLVDEYQDTNVLQAEILYGLSPTGKGLTVVGDDAQSIYSFRAATVRNILDFPKHYRRHDRGHAGAELPQHPADPRGDQRRDRPGRRAVRQEPLVRAAARASSRSWSPARTRTTRRTSSIRQILDHREEGIDLRRQAVLFRARTTACSSRPNWRGGTSPSTSTAG